MRSWSPDLANHRLGAGPGWFGAGRWCNTSTGCVMQHTKTKKKPGWILFFQTFFFEYDQKCDLISWRLFLNFSGPQQGEQRPNATSRTTGAQTFILQDFLPISCEVVFFSQLLFFFPSQLWFLFLIVQPASPLNSASVYKWRRLKNKRCCVENRRN